MLGWFFNVYAEPQELEWEERKLESGEVYARVPHLDRAVRLRSWSTPPSGLDWLDDLVKQGEAELLALNGGYPMVYRASWADVQVMANRRQAPEAGGAREEPQSVIVEVWDQS